MEENCSARSVWACQIPRTSFPGGMAKLVLLHRTDLIYDDEPDRVYDFPRSYLSAMQEGRGDWVVYYEPVKAGTRGYFAAAKIRDVVAKPGVEGRFLARIEPGSYIEFDKPVERLRDGRPFETALAHPDGRPKIRWGATVGGAPIAGPRV